jgi:hypothetical protein
LEALNTDVIILILSDAGSLGDLGALIRASPILYREFLSAKKSILLRVGAYSLGPAIRDAVVLAHTELKPFVNDKEYYDRVEETVAIYRLSLSQRKAFWTAGFSTEMAVCIVRLNRTIQYFTDRYICVRLAYFERNLYPACHWGVTVNERHQIAQAFCRYQIIVSMFCAGSTVRYFDRDFLLSRFVALFEPWEMEQVLQVNHFVFVLCSALVRCEKMSDGSSFTPEIEQAMQRASQAAMPPHRSIPELNGPRGWYPIRYPSSLSAFRAKLLEATTADAELRREIMDYPDLSNGRLIGRFTQHPFLCARHKHVPWDKHKTFKPPPPSVPCNLVSESPMETPWGWTEALGHRDDEYWGLELIPLPPPFTGSDIRENIQRKFELWRWLGLVFWDATRVEAINNTELMAEFEPGWLAAPWG